MSVSDKENRVHQARSPDALTAGAKAARGLTDASRRLKDSWAADSDVEANCRFCGSPLEKSVLDLGSTPLANTYAPTPETARRQPSYRLHVKVCGACLLVQHDAIVDSKDIFSEYAYFSSYSHAWIEHARRYVHMAFERFHLGPTSQVIEIASNDGYLLRHSLPLGVPVLGIDPAKNVAQQARSIGVPTEARFFGVETALDLKARGIGADLLIANNVLAHVPDINDMVAGIALVLKKTGIFTAEFPHLLRLMEEAQFDTIYHEHFFYYSLLAMERILGQRGLEVFDVEELPTHGGSLRIFVQQAGQGGFAACEGLLRVREAERRAGLDRLSGYSGLADKANAVKAGLLRFLAAAKLEGKRVAGFGAAAKGNTLLNNCGIDDSLIEYVVDETPYKIGKFLPGSHLPVVPPEIIRETRPDFVLILPWNHKDEIMQRFGYIREWSGRFVIPLPELTVFN